MNPRVRFLSAVLLAAITVGVAPDAGAADVAGTNGDDVLFGGNRTDRIRGLVGDDILFGKAGSDRLSGGSGDDVVFGGAGADRIDGDTGNDTLYDDDSRRGDVIRGGDGNDIIFSADGAVDTVRCGPGTDVAVVDRNDRVRGCERKIRKDGRFSGSRIDFGGNGNDFFDFAIADNTVVARKGNDVIRTGGGDDILLGGGGSDSFVAEGDRDVIVDDDSGGNDSVQPGDGRDVIFAADGARTSIDCSNEDDDGDNDVAYVDVTDAVIDCGRVFRG